MRRRLSQLAIHYIPMNAIRKTAALSLLWTLAGGISLTVQAADPPATPAKPAPPTASAPKKPIQQMLTGKVVKVDKLSRSVTIQVNNLTYVLQITDSTRINRSGKEKTLADIVVGEEINVNLVLRELPNGRVEVAVLSMDLAESVAAQGERSGGSSPNQPAPFQNGPNPANVDGPIISP